MATFRQLHKFGGSSLADPECYRRVVNILKEYSSATDLVVVSAAGKTTNRLIEFVEALDKDGRIAILEETEKRLRNRLRAAKESGEQTSALVEGLRKANDKNKHLKRENQQLMANIRKMTTAIKNHQEAQSRS